ncbi:kinase-like protein [Thelephora ganbajun]|uniref:Kinase-like protein n=1 Tax=Thelephora ganbajun TaxID=370292 RepID=A0ACB6ZBE3_THEGA|nr:kinase-like protein [Thelephora ganbajun]
MAPHKSGLNPTRSLGLDCNIRPAKNHGGTENPVSYFEMFMSAVIPSEHLLFNARDTLSRLLLASCDVDAPDKPQSLPSEIVLSPMYNPGTPPEYLVDAVWHLKPFLPVGCGLLGQRDLKIVGSCPVDAGGFSDLWVGERNDGTVVAVKSYRYYSSSSCLPIYLRLCKEASTCGRLNNSNNNLVSFIGVYSTCEHPFALVFEFMDHLNLGEYLRNNREIWRMKLLLEIARGLSYIHSLGIAHGNVKITNVLVGGDGRARVAGLGTASILHASVQGADVDRSFHGAAPGLIDPQRWGSTDSGVTMANDVYAFAVLAWEVFAGRSPFSNGSVVAGVHSMLNGRRLTRPNHPELSSRVWKLIKGCLKSNSTHCKTMAEVVTVFEAEVNTHQRL